MFAPIMPPLSDALVGFPLLAGMSFGDALPVGLWALLPICLAVALFPILLVARDVTRRYERRQIEKTVTAEPTKEAPLSRAA